MLCFPSVKDMYKLLRKCFLENKKERSFAYWQYQWKFFCHEILLGKKRILIFKEMNKALVTWHEEICEIPTSKSGTSSNLGGRSHSF